MYASSHHTDFAFRKTMNDEIKEVCTSAAMSVFADVELLGSTFMVKSKGEKGSLAPHQDWSIVDEREYNSYNIWLPLVDVNEANGTLLILEKSHAALKNIRGLNIPSSYAEVTEALWQYLTPVNLKAGEAFVYDHRLLHASGINNTLKPRLAIVYGLIPKGATMRYYFGRANEIEEYSCTPDFYFNETITDGPSRLSLLKTFKNQNPVVSTQQLTAIYTQNSSFFSKLKKWLVG
jgi:ectoine hydroxylase-related dioxygenase (phytanoyl-CoA dioxygenase family)